MKRWFNSLKVSQKLMLICIFFVMPDSLMLYFFITGINANIRFAQLEKEGNEYQRPLETLLELIPQHEALAAEVATGTAASKAALARKETQIDAAFSALEAVNARLGVELQFTEEGLARHKREHYCVRTVKAEWQELKSHGQRLQPEESVGQHTHLMTDVRTMITHAGDMSNLILDPQLDSYYLVDVTLMALPQTQDRLSSVMTLGRSVLSHRTLSNPDRQQMAIYATFLKEDDLDRITDSLQTCLNANPEFYGGSASLQAVMPPLFKKYKAAAERFINLTTRIVDSGKIDVTAQEYFNAGAAARDTSFRLWERADRELDVLLQKRIEYYQHRRARSLMVASLAVLAACSFVTFITKSISGPLRQQAAELRRSEEQLAAAQTIAQIGSWEWDISANKMIWSNENYRIHGLEPGKFKVSHEATLQFVAPDERAQYDQAIKSALQDGKPFSFDQKILRPDGSTRMIHQRGDVVRGPDGRTIKIVGTVQDITERKRAEDELESMHKQLLDISRKAGMAEVATGVLHNVGNVLNSVSVSVTLVGGQLRQSKIANLRRATAMLRGKNGSLGEFLTNDPKGKLLPEYLGVAADELADEQAEMTAEMQSVSTHIEHIKEIVSMQQNYARVSGAFENLPVAKLVDDALQMNAAAFSRHQVSVIREIPADLPPVCVDRHKVLQILINLFSNAKYAMDDQDPAEKQLVIRVEQASSEKLKIIVRDNGVGIAPDHLVKIFTSGFTTKKDGHGFGLHSGANAAREIGGALIAHSDGVGLGASFILELPVTAQKKPAAVAKGEI